MTSRLLLVDDQPRNLALLAALLRSEPYDIESVESGADALDAFAARGADLVLLDVRMPGMDGFETLARLRARVDGTTVPVILVTAHSEHEARLRGLDAGADEFIEKPIDRAVLLARVRSLLRMKHSRDALAARNLALERLQQEQRELTSFIVHDLKNPISVIQANLQWTRERVKGLDSEVASAVDDMGIALRRLRALVEDMLVIARLEDGHPIECHEPVTLGTLLNDVERAHVREIDAREVEVRVAVRGTATVRGDRALLRRVIENLTENALRHTPRGGSIELACESDSVADVIVSNTGRPIPVEQRQRIFDKFQRGADATPTQGNVGLGLQFCKRVAEAHGGEIALIDRPEWPVSFRVRLPMAS